MLKLSDKKQDGTFNFNPRSPDATHKIIENFKTILASDPAKDNKDGVNRSIIKAIEKYNEDEKIPFDKRSPYSISLGGDVYAFQVAHIKFMEGNEDILIATCRDLHGHPAIDYTFESKNNKTYLKSAIQVLTTHIFHISTIMSVQFGSYDTSIENLINPERKIYSNDTTILNIASKLSKMFSEMNAYKSSGEYKNLISYFNRCMINEKYNEYDYDFDTEAYNLYNKVWNLYTNTISEIVKSYKYHLDDKDSLITNNMKFVDMTEEEYNKLDHFTTPKGYTNNQHTFTYEYANSLKEVLGIS